MRMTLIIVGGGILALASTGCVATHKYVGKTIAPVESRVSATETKNNEQDTKLGEHGKQIEEVGNDLSRTKERLTDTDSKATAAGQAAQQAGQRADAAQKSADGAHTLAQTGVDKADAAQRGVSKAVDTMDKLVKFQMLKTETVLFPFNQYKLSAESKQQLDDVARQVEGHDRYVIEIQGYTDKSGTADVNFQLSQMRAQEVVRYLVNEHKIPIHNISSIGSGYTAPVADDATRDGRKMNRRVEVRLFVPEIGSATSALALNE